MIRLSNIDINVRSIILGSMIGALTVMISIFFPARTVAKMNPIDTVKPIVQNSEYHSKSFREKHLLYTLAKLNDKRNKKRYRITFLAILSSSFLLRLYTPAINFIKYRMTVGSDEDINIDALIFKKIIIHMKTLLECIIN